MNTVGEIESDAREFFGFQPEKKGILGKFRAYIQEKIVSSFWGEKVDTKLTSEEQVAQNVADEYYPGSVFKMRTRDGGYLFDQVNKGEAKTFVLSAAEVFMLNNKLKSKST